MGDSFINHRGRRLFVSPLALQPPMCFKYPGGSSVTTRVMPGPGHMVAYQLGQQHHVIQTCQKQMNFLMDGTSLFPKWRYPDGSPWKQLIEHGILDDDTEDALEYYQMLWGLQPTGILCPFTRTLLNPYVRLRGQLRYPSLTFRGNQAMGTGSSGISGQTSNQTPKKATPSRTPSTTTSQGQTPATTTLATPAADDDDKPWVPQLKWNTSLGATRPLWVGKTLSGAAAPGSAWKTELDRKLELDVELPTSLMIGDGHLTLSLGGEIDDPLDAAHRGKQTVQGNFQASLDDVFKRNWGSLSPYVQGSIQKQGDQETGVIKGGLELKIQPWKDKNVALKADANSGYQWGIKGLDPRQDPKAVIPIEGNLTLEVTLPTPW
jgi:hypothetical protein